MTNRTLYEWFSRSVRLYPDAPALELAGATLSYRALEACAGALAGRIVRAYGGPPRRVALAANRSLVAFAGYLAIQRLGATVVPLNPGHPAPRNRLILDAAPCDVLLCDDSGALQFDAGLADTPARPLHLGDAQLPTLPRDAPPTYRSTPREVAYVLFTSGSTGRPKGVPISHANLAPYLAHTIARYRVGPGCRMSHTFDLTFDPSVFDLFVTWGAGATLICPPASQLLTPVSYLVEQRITHWFSVPSVVSVSLDLGNLPEGLATGVRHSIFIGEPLTYRQARAWHAAAPLSTIDNVYGPTELTVACTEYRLPADPGSWPVTSNDTVPIGPPYGHLEHVVVDADGNRAADGELCVRGAQRFDGYLDPRDNSGRFLAPAGARFVVETDPRTAARAVNYYRTGDRVRREHGELVHLGRLDHQVKVRGYRVELGEIETALTRHPDVTQAVVVALRAGEETVLTACYCGTAVSDAQLVRWLRGRLPLHVVPRRYRHLDTMPLNANGKIDRQALHRMVERTGAGPLRSTVVPADPVTIAES